LPPYPWRELPGRKRSLGLLADQIPFVFREAALVGRAA